MALRPANLAVTALVVLACSGGTLFVLATLIMTLWLPAACVRLYSVDRTLSRHVSSILVHRKQSSRPEIQGDPARPIDCFDLAAGQAGGPAQQADSSRSCPQASLVCGTSALLFKRSVSRQARPSLCRWPRLMHTMTTFTPERSSKPWSQVAQYISCIAEHQECPNLFPAQVHKQTTTYA